MHDKNPTADSPEPPEPPDMSPSQQAQIAAEIAQFTRRPQIRANEITIRQYADYHGISYGTAITELENAWRRGDLLRRKIHHQGAVKWAYIDTNKVPDRHQQDYQSPPNRNPPRSQQ